MNKILVAMATAGATLAVAPGASATYTSDVAATADLASHWRLDETSGAKAYDVKKVAIGGYVNGVRLGQPAPHSRAGTSAALDGVNDRVDLGDVYDHAGTKPFTVEAWLRPSTVGASSTWRRVVSKENAQRHGYALTLAPNTAPTAHRQRLLFERRTSSGADAVWSTTALKSGVWYHVAATYDGTSIRMFVNGQLEGRVGSEKRLPDSGAALRLGASSQGGGYFGGSLDDVAVYSTALSSAVVTQHHASGVAAAPDAGAAPEPPATATPAPTVSLQSWRPAGSAPLSDAAAASLVTPQAEKRSANASENAYRPTAAELEAFRYGQRDRYGRTAAQYNRHTLSVTGGFTGTTDEIIQWAAAKWGIPVDVVRAVAFTESSWYMGDGYGRGFGDRKTVSNPWAYPALSRIAGTNDVYQSLGITQVKWTPEGMHAGTEPLRWRSTAFNLDYWGSVVRYYYDGLCDWCGSGYGAGQAWNSVAAWYNPSPWGSSTSYADKVKAHMAARSWLG